MTENRGGRHKKEPRGGQPKNSRASSKSQRQRRDIRLTKGRVKNALEDARRNRAWLEAELAKAIAAGGPETLLPPPAKPPTPKPGEPALVTPKRDPWREGDADVWPLGIARMLIKDGYHISYAVKRTGWGEHWFRDLVGNDGYAKAEWGIPA